MSCLAEMMTQCIHRLCTALPKKSAAASVCISQDLLLEDLTELLLDVFSNSLSHHYE